MSDEETNGTNQMWPGIVAANKSVALTTAELDQLLSVLFRSNSANYKSLSAMFKLLSNDNDTAFQMTSDALDALNESQDMLVALFDALTERLK
ncbi:hypothetical protein [Devosia submarina]|uniref:hypothetical protein n=1 Tax=Devosia submarina TaxID=1173082 RepID=UPI000D33E718|nr:hypothetical protein [Devosia submarina]